MAVDDYDFEPLFPEETEAAIRQRWNEWANEGLDPATAGDEWTDTREGHFFHLVTQPGVREAARTYDRMGTEVVAAAHPLWAWENYLDDHAEVQGVDRLAATRASGWVTFYGEVGTPIPAGTPVGVEPATPDADAPEFATTASGVIGEYDPTLEATGLFEADAYPHETVTSAVVADAAATQGIALEEESVGTPGQNSVRIAEGTPGIPVEERSYAVWVKGRALQAGSPGGVHVGFWEAATSTDRFVADGAAFTALDYEWVYLGQIDRPAGNPEVYVKAWSAGGGVRLDQIAFVASDGPPTEPNAVSLPVTALEAGLAGNVPARAVTALLAALPGVTVSNAEPMIGGADTETDDNLRERLLEVYGGEQGGWNVRLYKIAARAYSASIGGVTVIPLWNGPNTVKIVITDHAGQPLPQVTVDGLQAFLDPVPGKGHGEVTIGAQVTVVTASTLAVAVAGTVEFEPGYSLDGFGGTTALRVPIEQSVEPYVEGIGSGGEVVLKHVEARIVNVNGVHDISDVTINGAAANLAVPADPARVPQLTKPMALVEGGV